MPRQSQRSQASKRFLIRLPDGTTEPQPKAEVPAAVLNKALRLAENHHEPGVWEVIEYEDVIYRAHRLPGPKLDVRVEIVRE